jgi:hypothetical protein
MKKLTPLLVLMFLVMASSSVWAAKGFESSFKGFKSEAEFLKYLRTISDGTGEKPAGGIGSLQTNSSMPSKSATGDGASQGYGGMSATGDAEASPSNATITNNQEQGVDEGGIVKNIGSGLVVLRQGRLFAVDLDKQGQAHLSDSIRVAQTDALNTDVWYDEMLVNGDRIYVIGYRYGIVMADDDPASQVGGVTEFSSFRLSKGRLKRLKSTYFESNDYYSGENYASRMVDGRLITYMPFYVDPYAEKPTFPRILSYIDRAKMAGFQIEKNLFDWRSVLRPAETPYSPSFQTIVSCGLPADGSLDCKARALLDNWYGQHYVSRDHIFLWGENRVAAFNIKTLAAATHRVEGYPTSHMAFSERKGVLRVAVTDDESTTKILHLPLRKFAAHGQQKEIGAVMISDESGWLSQQRWIGDWYVAGREGDGYSVIGYDDATRKTQTLQVAGTVQKVEAMPGVGALIVVATDNGISLMTGQLDGALELIPAFDFQGASITEWRTHGFFFQPKQNGGIFGLPVVNESGGVSDGFWSGAVSSVSFFGVQKSGLISRIGQISASGSETQCETSCVDWYGNTRPIFLGSRIFALMGSEIGEASISVRAREKGDKTRGPNYHLTEHGKRVNLTFREAAGAD